MNLSGATLSVNENPLEFITRPTPQLRVAVARQQAVLVAEDFADLLAGIRGLFEKYRAKLAQFGAGAERARALHAMMDREMKAVAAIPLSCGRGCAGYCSYEVEITLSEAALLRDAVRGGVEIDGARLALQAARERQAPEWKRFGHADNRCVFLGEDGACRIYEYRPSICRKHVVTTPASACTTAGEAVAPVQVLLAEILLSAELSLEGTEFGSLSKLLTRELAAVAG